MPYAEVGSIRIHYSEAGEGEPLLLIMGYGMPGDAWLASLPFLQGFRAVYYDNRGTGRSDKPPGPYAIAQMAEDAAMLLQHLGIDRAHVYGISMGGMIAQELALNEPDRIRSLVLGCTLCGGTEAKLPDDGIVEELIETVRSMGSVPPEQWVDRQLPLIFPRDWIAANPSVRDLLVMAVQTMPPTPAATANAAIGGLFGWSSYERLSRIEAPTLIVHGDEDILIPVENAHVLAKRIPGARLHIVRGAGHGYPAQDPVGVHQVITDFLRAH